MSDDLFTQSCTVDVGINFRCLYALMTQHCLYHTQIRTAFQKMGGKRVTESMRADILLYPHHGYKLLDKMEHHYTGKRFLESFTYEDIILVTRFDFNSATVAEIGLKLGYCPPGDWHQALFVTLACHTYELLGQI